MSVLASILGRRAGSGIALEVASDRVTAIRLSPGAGGGVAARAVEVLPRGAMTPSIGARNVQDRPVVAAAVSRVLDAVGRPSQAGLLVPDPIAKVSLIRLERVPDRRDELDQLVRWHVRKAVPFPPEEARVAWAPAATHADGREFVVTVARKAVVEEYEELCLAAGAHPGTVDLSTFNLANAILSNPTPPASDWLLVHVTSDYASLALLRDGDLLFFRSRTLDRSDAVPDLVHQTAMYYEDRLKGRGLTQVVLAWRSEVDAAARDDVRRRIEHLFPGIVQPVDDGAVLPLVGLLRRGRSAA